MIDLGAGSARQLLNGHAVLLTGCGGDIEAKGPANMKPSALSEPDLLGSLSCCYGPRQRQAERDAADTDIALAICLWPECQPHRQPGTLPEPGLTPQLQPY
jgi:hypothetical protein